MDVDFDLFYDEDANIGQKIKLSEAIERALRSMACPAPLQAHQIQGLDYPALFPVVQWLVKRVLATREEFGDQRRSYALHAYSAHGYAPLNASLAQAPERCSARAAALAARFPVLRRLRRVAGAQPHATRAAAVRCTLLEYGHRLAAASGTQPSAAQHSGGSSQAAAARAAMTHLSLDAQPTSGEAHALEAAAVAEMAVAGDAVLSGSQAARLVGLRGSELAQAAARAAAGEEPTGAGARAQALSFQLEAAQRALQAERGRAEEAVQLAADAASRAAAAAGELRSVVEHNERCVREARALEAELGGAGDGAAERLLALLRDVQALKAEEAAFKAECRARLAELGVEAAAAEAAAQGGAAACLGQEEAARLAEIAAAHAAAQQRQAAARAALARRALGVSLLQRRLDDLPCRPELAQYERRFVELAETVAAKLAETRRCYAQHNCAADALRLLQTEVALLNKLRTQYDGVRGAGRDVRNAFTASMAGVATGVADNLRRAEERAARERAALTEATEQHAAAVQRTRAYFAAVKRLQDELATGAILQGQLANHEPTAPH